MPYVVACLLAYGDHLPYPEDSLREVMKEWMAEEGMTLKDAGAVIGRPWMTIQEWLKERGAGPKRWLAYVILWTRLHGFGDPFAVRFRPRGLRVSGQEQGRRMRQGT